MNSISEESSLKEPLILTPKKLDSSGVNHGTNNNTTTETSGNTSGLGMFSSSSLPPMISAAAVQVPASAAATGFTLTASTASGGRAHQQRINNVEETKQHLHMHICEEAMKVFAVLLIIITLPWSLMFCLIVVAQYERAVVFRLGKLVGLHAKGPGLVFVLPCLDSVKRVDLRTFTFDVPTQEVLTKDSVTVAVDAVVYYRVYGPVMSVINVEDANRSTRLLAQTMLRNFLGMVDLYQLLTAREHIAHLMQGSLDQATYSWGVKVERVEIKDVRLPTQLQRAMAAEAEATREARAKVIAAEGEQRASLALKQAAVRLSECPVAIQLRYLQTLSSISAEKNSTIIFPLPIDIVKMFCERERNGSEEHQHTPTPTAIPKPSSTDSSSTVTARAASSSNSNSAKQSIATSIHSTVGEFLEDVC